VAKNQTPIMNPTMRGGESFVTIDSPTGLKQSSPTICRKYKPISHHGLTRAPVASKARAAGTTRRNENERKKSPIVNFSGLEGLRLPRASQIQAKTGEKRMTNSGSTDWNQLDG